MNIRSGIKLLEEREGHGEPAKKGDRLRYNLRAFLNKGEELPINEVANLEAWPAELLRKEEGKTYINFACELGKRQNVAAVEYSLYGMKEGGYRKLQPKKKDGFTAENAEHAEFFFTLAVAPIMPSPTSFPAPRGGG